MLKKPLAYPLPSTGFIDNHVFQHPIRLIAEHGVETEREKSGAAHYFIYFADENEIVRISGDGFQAVFPDIDVRT